jgi:UDP-N-acetylmuramyl pentapeptide phosphotransferase/UDP-N-acetylglucosamine-1-phosphate transferase
VNFKICACAVNFLPGYFVWVVMLISLVSMLVCSILILLLCHVAFRLDIVDRPGGRKQHEHPMPTMGSMAGKTTLITILGVATIVHVAGEDGLLPLTLVMPVLLLAVSFYWLRNYMQSRHHKYGIPI